MATATNPLVSNLVQFFLLAYLCSEFTGVIENFDPAILLERIKQEGIEITKEELCNVWKNTKPLLQEQVRQACLLQNLDPDHIE